MDESAPVEPEEILYRLIPIRSDMYDPADNPPLSPHAFWPHKTNDRDGLSLVRNAAFNTPEEAALRGPNPHGYFVAEVQAADLLSIDLTLAPTPNEQTRGHVSVSNLNSANRRTLESEARAEMIVRQFVRAIYGPFLKPAPPDPSS